MRLIGWLLLILLTLGWLASELPSTAVHAQATKKTEWRRTRDGWERPTWSRATATSCRLTLHPALIALLEISLVSAVLIAFDKDKGTVWPPIRT